MIRISGTFRRLANWLRDNFFPMPAPIAPPEPRRSVNVSDMLLARVKSLGKTQSPPHPFRIPSFPKAAMPQDAGMALDDLNGAFNWALEQSGQLMVSEGLVFLGYPYLSELAQRPEYRRMVETLARHMTRKWIKLKTRGDDGEDAPMGESPLVGAVRELGEQVDRADKDKKIRLIEKEFVRLRVKEIFQRAAEHDGFFGRGHIFLDFGEQGDANPNELKLSIGSGSDYVSKSKVNKEAPLRRLINVEPTWTYPQRYNTTNPLRPDWYKPQSWLVMGKELHGSRLMTFISREVPDILKPAYAFGGLPLSQIAKPYVDNWLDTRRAVAAIIRAFSIFVLKTNMVEKVNANNGEAFYNRLSMFNSLRDNSGILAVDKETEDFANVSAPLSGLDHLQAQTQEHMAAVSGIPLVELLGISPTGLNASSEGEIKTFYEWIHSCQEMLFRPNIEALLGFVQLSLFGEVDPDIIFDFEPLGALDEKELAEKRKTEADIDVILVEAGILDISEVRKRISEDEDSPYNGIDPDDAPTMPGEGDDMGMPPMPGQPPQPGAQPGVKPPASPQGAIKGPPSQPAPAPAPKGLTATMPKIPKAPTPSVKADA